MRRIAHGLETTGLVAVVLSICGCGGGGYQGPPLPDYPVPPPAATPAEAKERNKKAEAGYQKYMKEHPIPR